MKALFVHTSQAESSIDHLNSIKVILNKKYAPEFYDKRINCDWELKSSLLNLPFEFKELDIIFIYMTEELNGCKFLESIILNLATQYAIKVIFIYAEYFSSTTPLAIASQSNSSVLPSSALEELDDLEDGVHLDKQSNPSNPPPPPRHRC
ncbi:hypothetical protein ACTXJ2_07670 [Psychrobacter alimentarius]|uniref:hypothetical protein n=1 Tax=Psychrobacter TaxID=497 RepID=UPI000BAAF7C3|nr:hypothetical protein [Psychrobacter sp. JB193]PAT64496.1 hypothetical protein CIK80_05300 [Psychrobacter sp. JB193]